MVQFELKRAAAQGMLRQIEAIETAIAGITQAKPP
jgi:hypothetical protein